MALSRLNSKSLPVQIHWLGNGLRLKIAGPLRLRLFLLRIGAFRCRGRNLDTYGASTGIQWITDNHKRRKPATRCRRSRAFSPEAITSSAQGYRCCALPWSAWGPPHTPPQIAGHSCGADRTISAAHTLSGHGFSIHRGALNIHLRHGGRKLCRLSKCPCRNAPGVQRSVHDQRAVIDDVLAVQGLVMQGFPFGNIQVFHCDRSFLLCDFFQPDR